MDWFRRFGDIPGVEFDCPPGVEPSKLRGYGAVPETQVFTFDGKRRESRTWPRAGAGGSASPAHERAFQESKAVSSAGLLRNCHEGLELPGEPSDYHFLIQGTAKALWGLRRREPAVLADAERLCWLDIQLIDARPDAVAYESDKGKQEFATVLAFSLLIDMYEREGSLREALDVAERATRFGQAPDARERLIERIAAVDSEEQT